MTDTFARFAGLHRPGDPLLLPNAWDVASAVVLARAGHPAIGTTSLGVALAAGKPDATGATRGETVALARRLTGLSALLTVDIEAGFSDDPAEVADLAAELAAAGAIGVNIEDGTAEQTLSPVEAHAAKVAAVKDRVPGLFVNARTDPFWLPAAGGADPEGAAVRRAAAYLAAGADGIFVPGVADLGAVARLVAEIPAPLNVLYLPGKHTLADLAAAGVARVSTGSLLLRSALQTVVEMARAARDGAVLDDPDRPTYGQLRDALPGVDR